VTFVSRRSSTPAYDYVIVGGGPAGCVLAYRLSADPSIRILVLEAGTGRNSIFSRLLARFVAGFDPGIRFQYETVPQAKLNNRRIYFPQGRTLGGGSAINAMTYVRGQPGDYDCWRAAGNEGWDWASVSTAFHRLERNHVIADGFHGQDGPLHVSNLVDPHVLTRRFVEAACETGLPENHDFNGRTQEGAGTYQLTQRKGKRCSAADAFVRSIRHRPNLTVLTHTAATRVVAERGRATGVEFLRSGRIETARASNEVIVSCGAINSPKLLLLSGIGPAAALRRLNIPVVADVPGVGRNLQDHLNVQVVSRCSRPITYDHWDRPLRFVKFGLQYLLFNRGFATSNLCEAGAFLRSRPEAATPDIQLHFMPLIWLDHGRKRVEDHGMTLEATFLRPESRGSVTLASSDALAPPLIDPQYCTASQDLETLVRALRRCRDIMHARAFRGLAAAELLPGPDVRTDEDLAEYVRASGITSYHPVGTCRMGTDDFAVVNPRLQVRGISGLRVVDSSIMPRIVSGSTQAPSMMVGEMAAAMIREGP